MHCTCDMSSHHQIIHACCSHARWLAGPRIIFPQTPIQHKLPCKGIARFALCGACPLNPYTNVVHVEQALIRCVLSPHKCHSGQYMCSNTCVVMNAHTRTHLWNCSSLPSAAMAFSVAISLSSSAVVRISAHEYAGIHTGTQQNDHFIGWPP
jgi:hypothetical protein